METITVVHLDIENGHLMKRIYFNNPNKGSAITRAQSYFTKAQKKEAKEIHKYLHGKA